jgi:hypothetical protein
MSTLRQPIVSDGATKSCPQCRGALIMSREELSIDLWLRVAAATCIAVTIVTTLTVNVPINTRTAGWQLPNDASEWQQMRE